MTIFDFGYFELRRQERNASSGFVSRPRMRDMTSERFVEVNTSMSKPMPQP